MVKHKNADAIVAKKESTNHVYHILTRLSLSKKTATAAAFCKHQIAMNCGPTGMKTIVNANQNP